MSRASHGGTRREPGEGRVMRRALLAGVLVAAVLSTATPALAAVTSVGCVDETDCTWFQADSGFPVRFEITLDEPFEGVGTPDCLITGDVEPQDCGPGNTAEVPGSNRTRWIVTPAVPDGFEQGRIRIQARPPIHETEARVDLTPPPPPALTAPPGWSASRRPVVTASGSSGVAAVIGYALAVDGGAPLSPTHDATGAVAPASDLADGEHTYHVRACDERPSCGDESTALVRVDGTPPGAPPALAAPSHPYGMSRSGDLRFTWNAPTDLSGVTGYSVALDDRGDTEPDGTVDTVDTGASFPGRSAGSWWFHVRAVDGAGNLGTTAHLRVDVLAQPDPAPARRPFPPRAPTRWFVAEGSSGPGFDTWILVANPSRDPVNASITYLTPAGVRTGPRLTVPALTRVSVRVADTVIDDSVATEVVGEDGPLVVERALYADRDARRGTHSTAAVAVPSPTWAFPEGSTAPGFETWVLLANAGAEPTTATLYLQTSGRGTLAAPQYTVPPRSRVSIRLNDLVVDPEVASLVFATGPIYAERATYLIGGSRAGDATASTGSPRSAAEWFVAEGAAAPGLETWILIQNPNRDVATASVTFHTGAGPVAPAGLSSVRIEPGRRTTIRVNDWVESEQAATSVRASAGVVVERATYYDRPGMVGATADVGTAAGDTVWYVAEGATTGGFDTWLLIANPGTFATRVQLTYLTPLGPLDGGLVKIEPGQRISLREADHAAGFYDVAAIVSSLDGGVIAVERVTFGTSGVQGGRPLPAGAVLDAAGL